MAKKTAKPSIEEFLANMAAGSDTGTTPTVANATQKQIADALTQIEHATGSGPFKGFGEGFNIGSLDIQGATPKQTKETEKAIEAGYSPKDIAQAIFGGEPGSAGKTKDANLPSPTAAAQSPFTELAQQLAQTYLQQIQQLQSLTSGAATPGLEATATTGAEAALKGLGVGGAATSFLANTPTDPMAGQLEASQKALGNAQAAGAIPYSEAIAGTGPANAAGLQAAPYSQILNELANTAAYRASSPSYGAQAFGATTANTPVALQYIFKQLGLPIGPPGQGTGTAGAGLTAPTTAAKGGAGSTSTAVSPNTSQTG